MLSRGVWYESSFQNKNLLLLLWFPKSRHSPLTNSHPVYNAGIICVVLMLFSKYPLKTWSFRQAHFATKARKFNMKGCVAEIQTSIETPGNNWTKWGAKTTLLWCCGSWKSMLKFLPVSVFLLCVPMLVCGDTGSYRTTYRRTNRGLTEIPTDIPANVTRWEIEVLFLALQWQVCTSHLSHRYDTQFVWNISSCLVFKAAIWLSEEELLQAHSSWNLQPLDWWMIWTIKMEITDCVF